MSNGDDFGAEALSVIVLPAGPEGDGLLEVARRWTATWMLAPALWVRAEDVPSESDGPPEIKALVLGRGPFGGADEVEVELFWKLGERFRPRVRLVAVRMLQSREDDATTANAINLIDLYLERALPTRLPIDLESDPDAMVTEFLRLNLIVDAAEVSGISASSVFKADWQANIVASPEDRSTPFSPDAPPIHPRKFRDLDLLNVGETKARAVRYYGWAMAHLATVAGIWTGLTQSIYDLMPSRPSVAHSMCIVQRICVRGIVTDGLAINLAADSMEVALQESEEASRQVQVALSVHGIETIPDSDVNDRAQQMVDVTLSGFRDQGFGYRSFEDPGPYRVPKVPLGKRLGEYLKLGGTATLRSPKFVTNLVLQRLGRSLTIEDGDAIVESLSTWNPGLPTIDDSAFAVPSASLTVKSGMKSSPQVWRDLRDMIFASLDGNQAHDVAAGILSGSVSEQRMVFPSKSDVLPDPRKPWKHEALQRIDAPPFPEIDWMDSATAKETLDLLTQLYQSRAPQVHQLRQELEKERQELMMATRDFERLDHALASEEAELAEANAWLDEMLEDHPHTSVTRRMAGMHGVDHE